ELDRIESLVNEHIWTNTPLQVVTMDLDSAIAGGALALFGEKYGEEVRTIEIPGFSKELCGGTHVRATGEIGFFTVTYEAGIGAGVRRIEALTGPGAYAHIKQNGRILSDVRQVLRAQPDEEVDKLQRLATQQRARERQIDALQRRLATAETQDYISLVGEVARRRGRAWRRAKTHRQAVRRFG